MKKLLLLLLVLPALLFFKTPALAQLPPIKDSSTTVVGIGGSGGPPPGQYSFYCQYGGVNASGALNNRRSWDYGSCSIEIGGCAPSSIAMILTSLGQSITPTAVSKQNGGIGCGSSGTSTYEVDNVVKPWVKNTMGLNMPGNAVVSRKVPFDTIQNYLTRGYLVLGGAYVQWATSGGLNNSYDGHAFMIVAVDKAAQSVTVYDPTFCEGGFKGGLRVLKNVNDTSNGDVRCNSDGYCGWLWLYPIGGVSSSGR